MNNNLPVVYIPSNGYKVVDSPGRQNSFGIPSASSDAVYVIAQFQKSRTWTCGCRGFIRHRHCKHLAALQIPAGVPYEVQLKG